MRPPPDELSYAEAFRGHEAALHDLLARTGARRVLEIGGGRRPLLAPARIAAHGLDYTVLDISPAELAAAPPGYRTVVGDIADPGLTVPVADVDLAFSRFLAEHVGSGESFHRNVRRLLRPGGVAFHFFPTLWHPVFVANRLMPEALARRVFYALFPREYPKFPARYSWCRGPTPRMRAMLARVGLEIVEFRTFYGTYYLRRIPLGGVLDEALAGWAARRRSPYLCSYAYLVVRRPV